MLITTGILSTDNSPSMFQRAKVQKMNANHNLKAEVIDPTPMFQRAKVQKMNANHNSLHPCLTYISNVSKSKSTKNEC